MHLILLRTTQLIRGLRFTQCATQSQLKSVALAAARATQFLQTVGGAPTTSPSKGLSGYACQPLL